MEKTHAALMSSLLRYCSFCQSSIDLITSQLQEILKKKNTGWFLSRTDFSVMTDLGKETGVIKRNEQKIIQTRATCFSRVLVKDIMTPRIVVVASDESMTVEEFHDEHEKLPFSRIPVYKDDSDSITGLVLKDDILLSFSVEDEYTKPPARLSAT